MNAIISSKSLPKFFFTFVFANLICATAFATDTNKTNSAARLVIVKAIYGDPNDASATIDVTKQVAAEVKNDSIELRANNDNFEDPASGANKCLKVDYTIDGVIGKKTVWENGLLRLSIKDKPDPNENPSSKLIIRKAIFGDLPDGGANDVTDDVKTMVKDDSLNVTPDTDEFGDPAGGRPKKLQVDYTLDGKESSKTVAQGETLKISTTGN